MASCAGTFHMRFARACNPDEPDGAVYLPSQLTLLFQSTNAPFGFSLQAQTCSSKCAGRPYRFGLSTNWNDCP